MGSTIIEKLVDFSDVDYAIVLLTPDDLGASRVDGAEDLRPRARQNVILELGFFLGALGRGRVCALYARGVEIPSDYNGVLFIQLDEYGAWVLPMVKEMRAAGLSVDLSNLQSNHW
jgi:predicted nucleotide-binding protein